jgi:hypothetical protein
MVKTIREAGLRLGMDGGKVWLVGGLMVKIIREAGLRLGMNGEEV